MQSSELESPFDASVINKKIISLSSLVRRNVDVDRILELSLTSKAVCPSHSPPRQLSKNAKKRARRKQRRQTDRSGGEQTGVKSHRTGSAQAIDGIQAISNNRAIQPRLGSEASSDISSCPTSPSDAGGSCRIAVARDSAFCFYYEENLEMMRQHGLHIVYFSPLTEALPPNVAAVYLGGGVPELHASALADNRIFRAGMKKFVEAGGVVFAEGGGLLVLCQSLQTRTGFPQQPMVGVFPFRAIMTKAKVLKGYVEVTVGDDCPIFPHNATIRGYICSNSELVQEQHVGGIVTASEWKGTYQARLFAGRPAKAATSVMDGYSTCNVLGSYVHHHFGESPEVLKHFVQKCRQVNVGAVTNAVSSSRRIAEFLEGSVAYTPPLTPRRAYVGMTGVHSSPDLNLERKSRSRPRTKPSLAASQRRRTGDTRCRRRKALGPSAIERSLTMPCLTRGPLPAPRPRSRWAASPTSGLWARGTTRTSRSSSSSPFRPFRPSNSGTHSPKRPMSDFSIGCPTTPNAHPPYRATARS